MTKKLIAERIRAPEHEESSRVHRIGHGLTLAYAHMLPEVIMTAKVLSTSFDGTLVHCDGVTKKSDTQETQKPRRNNYSRLSFVWIDRTCRFKCSPRAKHLKHPWTVHLYIRMFFCTPPCTMNTGAVGRRRPRDFFVRFGTGTGAIRRQSRIGRTLPLPLLTLTLLVRREQVRDVRFVRKLPSSSSSEASLSPESLPKSSSVSPSGVDDP